MAPVHQAKKSYPGREERPGVEQSKQPATHPPAENPQKVAKRPKDNAMKTPRILATMGLLALAAAVFSFHGFGSADATPGKGAPKIGGIGPTPFFPLQCASVTESRTLVNANTGPGGLGPDAGGGFPVPVAPLSQRNKLFLCNSAESYVYTDAGVRAAAKCRVDGQPVYTGATTPGFYLPTPPISISQTALIGASCLPFEQTIWNADGGGGSGPTCVAVDNLTDAGPAVAIDVVECAF